MLEKAVYRFDFKTGLEILEKIKQQAADSPKKEETP